MKNKRGTSYKEIKWSRALFFNTFLSKTSN